MAVVGYEVDQVRKKGDKQLDGSILQVGFLSFLSHSSHFSLIVLIISVTLFSLVLNPSQEDVSVPINMACKFYKQSAVACEFMEIF